MNTRLQTYTRVLYHWTTHTAPGLSSKDIRMAGLCDGKTNILGHINGSKSEGSTLASPSKTQLESSSSLSAQMSQTNLDCLGHTGVRLTFRDPCCTRGSVTAPNNIPYT